MNDSAEKTAIWIFTALYDVLAKVITFASTSYNAVNNLSF